MTPQEFQRVYNRLAVALRCPQDDAGVELRVYYEVLQRWPYEAVKASSEAFAAEPGRRYFPTTGEWAGKALEIQDKSERAVLALPSGRMEPWTHECASCEDTGWVAGLTCDGGMDQWPTTLNPEIGRHKNGKPNNPQFKQGHGLERPGYSTCGKSKPHLPHDYTQMCACRPNNRTWLRHERLGGGAA